MKLAVVAVGQAGGKFADAMLRYQRHSGSSFLTDALAVNTAKADLLGLEEVPLDRRLLIGQSTVKGHGAGADNELGAELAREDIQEVVTAVDEVSLHDVDAFLVVAALGGGTGSGGAPVVAQRLGEYFEEPVYGLGVLPTSDEGGIYNLNAARSLQTFVRETDNVLLFDNDAWRRAGESLQVGYDRINDEIARRIGVLVSAGEARDPTPEKVVDASEIINTLGTGGVSTIGYASAELGRRRRAFGGYADDPVDETDAITRITSVVRRAALGRLTLPCELSSAERALVVVSGPPAYLSREGIEAARHWLEEATGSMEVRGGDYPMEDTDHVAGLVLLSGVTDVPRVKELQGIAVDTQRRIGELEAERAEALQALLWEGSGEIEPLF